MRLPPPNARPTGVLFERRGTTHAIGTRCGGVPPRNASEQRAEISSADHARLFGFESESGASLTYIPLAVRFKLDKCGIKVSLAQWNQLPVSERRKLLEAPCANGAEAARYGQALRRLISEVIGDDPQLIEISATPAWEDVELPGQIADKALQMNIRAPSSEQWRGLTALQRFALLKVSRASSDSRNLVPALREFGLL